MSERTDITDQIATLQAERAGLLQMERNVHARFMASEMGSDENRAAAESLDKIDARLDEISDDVGALEAQLYLIDARESRRERLADQAYGRML